MVGVILGYFGALEEAEAALRPMVEFGPPAMAMVDVMPYTALQMIIDDAFPPTARAYFKAEFMDEMTDEAIDDIIEGAAQPTSPLTQVLLEPMGGAILDTAPDETALAVRDPKWCYHALGVWTPEMGPDESHIAWTRAFAERMERHTTPGVYVNYTSDNDIARMRSTYGQHFDRLVALKDRYDPNNLFRLNSNIPPSAG
jgi:hypothetical protein